MRVVVTGAASFIGFPLVLKLLYEGNEVCAVVRPGSKSTKEFKKNTETMLSPDELNHLTVAETDLSYIEKLTFLTESSGFDAWFHLGWDGAGSFNRTKADLQMANVNHTLCAIKTAAELGCRRFVFVGSQAEYGICHEKVSEERPLNPVSEYGKAKAKVAKEAVPLSESLGIDYIHARIYSVYGPRDHDYSLINSCLNSWKRGEVIELGPCSKEWNFLYVNDAADALISLVKKGKPGFYNVAGEETRPLQSFIEEMAGICSARSLYVFGDRKPNAEGDGDLIPDLSKIKRDTGWSAKVAFSEGIRKMWEETLKTPQHVGECKQI